MRDIEHLRKEATGLSSREKLQLAQLLIADATQDASATRQDVNALAGTIKLGEDAMEIQKRLRSEWD